MTWLLDTNICIYIIKTHPAHVLDRFRQHDPRDIGISSLTAAELAFGVAKSGSARNQAALEKFLVPLTVFPFDGACAGVYGRVRADLARRGTPIGSIDQLIAAHALALDATLVTNNTREFERVDGLRIENWAEPNS